MLSSPVRFCGYFWLNFDARNASRLGAQVALYQCVFSSMEHCCSTFRKGILALELVWCHFEIQSKAQRKDFRKCWISYIQNYYELLNKIYNRINMMQQIRCFSATAMVFGYNSDHLHEVLVPCQDGGGCLKKS